METNILAQTKMGIGTWSWGDRLYWGYGKGYQEEDIRRVFQFCVQRGINFFDTAEVYGQGRSESYLGQFVREMDKPIFLGTKFMPYPWRLSSKSLEKACKNSLQRLGMEKISLYQIHMPLPPLSVESWMEGMIRVYEAGLVSHIGVSNYSMEQTQRAFTALNREGIPLTSNQVEYHLLNRKIEKNGLLKMAKDLGVKIIAYSPIAMGALSGKYNEENLPSGYRSRRYNRQLFTRIRPLLLEMGRIGVIHDGKSVAQVAINWVMCKGAIPIPGAKTLEQAEQNVESVSWTLTRDEVALLDDLSDRYAVEE
jgi:aryl-alcohol dehydrogenase-like predicted oxidoreductase